MEVVRCDFKCSKQVASKFEELMKKLEEKGVIQEFDSWGHLDRVKDAADECDII